MKNPLQLFTGCPKKEGKKDFPKVKLFLIFLVEFFIFFCMFGFFLSVLDGYFSPTDEEMMKMIKSFDIENYVVLSLGVLAYLVIVKERNYIVALIALFCVSMATSSQFLTLIPAEIDIGEVFGRQTIIYFPITCLFASFFGLAFNLVILIFKSVENNPAES